ncbi:MAG: circadian clock protein KaiA [Leptolyngbya sp. SIO4C1]|nr:circadian clock protein KaiA [Leptolyngbya sp. SIO4C1]
MDWVVSNRHRIDCLIIQLDSHQLLQELEQRGIFLPMLVVGHRSPLDDSLNQTILAYHDAVIYLGSYESDTLDDAIHRAINQFLSLPAQETDAVERTDESNHSFLLSLQQQRLAEKLKERLGYLGVYYKRNPQNFLRNLTPEERQEFIEKLRQDYRRIILRYFSNEGSLNQQIDDFVNVAFFADVSVSKIVEIHMELMDEFSKQLTLEGRSEEILLDYRLTLIDVIAHLCEMYRRSIPREL